MKLLPQLGDDGLESRLLIGSIERRYPCLICVDKRRGLQCLPSKLPSNADFQEPILAPLIWFLHHFRMLPFLAPVDPMVRKSP